VLLRKSDKAAASIAFSPGIQKFVNRWDRYLNEFGQHIEKLDVWHCPAWWPPVGWVRTLVLFFSICRPNYTELSLPVW